MKWQIEIKEKKGIPDVQGEGVRKDIVDLGLEHIKQVKVVQIYRLEGDLNERDVKRIATELLMDPIIHESAFFSLDRKKPSRAQKSKEYRCVEIAYNPGVMDPVEASTLQGIRDLGIKDVAFVRTAKRYELYGSLNDQQVDKIINRVLCNKLIQHVVTSSLKENLPHDSNKKFDLIVVPFLELKDQDLITLSQRGQLFLNLNEMKVIQQYFRKLGRNPTDCELETIAQTWSEHCHHKTFRGTIRYQEIIQGKRKTTLIKNLLKTTIFKATQKINKSWCVSVFHDNAGVIEFDQDHHVCFKVETHNHPSALEPFGGANTGVGGVIRDSLGTGLGAKPICNTDVFCFAPSNLSWKDVPQGALHPKRVMKGVVAGVRDYGNKMGIPTVNGAVIFDRRFVGNPLVFCGNVGLIPFNRVFKKVNPGDLIVAVGGRTGRDGIHGATFSSGELTQDSEVVSSSAVQIGNPIEEKKVLDALMTARDQNLFTAITDCGAGGFSSAVGEMGKDTGCRVDLEKVPLKYAGLKYTEIWISESQERMVLSVPAQKLDALLKVFADENVEAAVIGEFTQTKRLEIFFNGIQVADLSMEFIHEGIPKIIKEAIYIQPKLSQARLPKGSLKRDLTQELFQILSHPNVASKESIIRQYDHEVQGTSVLKPLVGVYADGPSDASVLRPKLNSDRGIAVSNGINIRFGMLDPFWMAASCIDEAVRQIIAVGGSLEKIAILDNFCWGNPDKPDRLGGLVRCAKGCYSAAVGLGVPFISGKDSLYNEYKEHGKSLAIPGTILISAIGVLKDVNKVVSMDFKRAGNLIYVVGKTFDELGGSIYLDTQQQLGDTVPKVNFPMAKKTYEGIASMVSLGKICSIHDCSEGGLAVAAAEMAFAGGLGVTVLLEKVPFSGFNRRDEVVLFSESNSRLLLEVDTKDQKEFEAAMKGIPLGLIGRVEASPEFIVYGINRQVCVNTTIDQLKTVWKNVLNF